MYQEILLCMVYRISKTAILTCCSTFIRKGPPKKTTSQIHLQKSIQCASPFNWKFKNGSKWIDIQDGFIHHSNNKSSASKNANFKGLANFWIARSNPRSKSHRISNHKNGEINPIDLIFVLRSNNKSNLSLQVGR